METHTIASACITSWGSSRKSKLKMLFQVGGQGTRPTFFEMAAAQQLPASLRSALTYSIGVSRI